ncbi:MAG: precorrin-2 C(20)-methyltransferase [Pseudomonadota bacterium]
MSLGILYGIGVGPGDPELITVKGARALGKSKQVFVPKPRAGAESLALSIAREYINRDALITTLVFPMSGDPGEIERCRLESARVVADALMQGEDACYLTLGDPLLYSTYVYLMRALRTICPQAEIVTVPGVTAFSAAAALSDFPLGAGPEPLHIVPAAGDPSAVKRAMELPGTVVLMKIGRRLRKVLGLLRETDGIDRAVFVARAGLEGQRIEHDPWVLAEENEDAGNMSVLIVHTSGGDAK